MGHYFGQVGMSVGKCGDFLGRDGWVRHYFGWVEVDGALFLMSGAGWG